MASRLARAIVAGVVLLLAIGLGTGAAATADESPWHARDAGGQVVVRLWFGYSSTCPHCHEAMPFVDELEERLPWLEVHRLRVDGPDAEAAVAKVEELAALAGERFQYVPAFLYAGRLVVGWDDASTTGAEMEAGLRAYRESLEEPNRSGQPGAPGGLAPESAGGESDGRTSVDIPLLGEVDAAGASLPLLAVVLGGLDAFNPCALSILLFLMSVLAGTGDRRRMALIGGIFVAVSGLVYFVLMAAWLNAFLIFGALRWVTVVAGVAAVAAALINLKDHVWFRRGISLQLPESAKPSVFGRILDIPEQARLRVMVLTTVLVAAVANTYEMLCTGGFPVVFTRVLTLSELPTPVYYGYLALYALIYVVPPALIVTAFVLTLGSRGVSVREARDLKLLSGLLMLGFGVLLLSAPELLGDLVATLGLFGGAILLWLVIVGAERIRSRQAHPASG
jgi:thiol-disulfide isomerase/thioredoxin